MEVMGCLFVDNTNLFVFDDSIGSNLELWETAQLSLDSWGTL